MSAPEKPVVIRLDVSDLRREVDNAALSALLEKRWTVLTSVVIADESGNWMSLVMVPPAPQPAADPVYIVDETAKGTAQYTGFIVGCMLTFIGIYALSAFGY